ncbi:ribonuclease H [Coccidioides posadasii str. Silveira]|uniref:ribonuclease H n=3 Tax=Coccidioides posadasii TaxID=199306 RepID=E9CRF4_COCPS|nr:ribonuclease H [Coccidioides posadasii str. Silveira]
MTAEPLKDEFGNEYPPGTGPLPPGAEDGFDPNILLDPSTGRLVYKTPEQKAATKLQAKPVPPPNMLKIYTDGSSLGNGKAVSKAGVGVYFGPGDERNVSEPLKGNRQTNQRAELTAISRALDIAPRHRDVTIYTDSKYAIDCVTVWFVRWQRNKWMTTDHKPVENKDLVQSIRAKIEERTLLNVKTLFEWVKGHNKDPGNEAADRLAVRGAKTGLQEINDGVGENEGAQDMKDSNILEDDGNDDAT